MIYFIKSTNFLNSLNYQNNFQILPNCRNAKEFNSFKTKSNLTKGQKMKNGCDSVVVSIGACGASGPGSNPGRGPWRNPE